jgi:type III pantothenate kinase
MILVFDVGNTETTVGLFRGDELAEHWRLTTTAARTSDEIRLMIHGLMQAAGVDEKGITGTAIGSVVPPVTPILYQACMDMFSAKPVVVNGSSKLPIKLKVDEPMTVGADRILNTLAASQIYKRDTIVVDLGTATTYDCITASGDFLGGIIQPGVISSAESLFRRTSQLPATEIRPPKKVIGTRTDDCIRGGVLFGAADSISGIVNRIRKAWPTAEEPYVVGTGGLAEVIAPHCDAFDHLEPFLTLHGLRLAHSILAA